MAQWSQKNLLKSYTTSISREKSLETNVSELTWAETEVNKMKKSLRARMQLDFYRTPIQINFQEINNVWFLKGSESDFKKPLQVDSSRDIELSQTDWFWFSQSF